ncbi:PREDICTED: dual specificity protein phosphatase 26-like [Nanorana parkeri]|uniref:dual specificity protein phosphatase 26-like n=1 Tax=Nanorana parkeri TaxID=125878 RepID=UPI000854A630|nr:PREDICTED: dual specificity protein phosphatase 26-like [Nanorana parkeri]
MRKLFRGPPPVYELEALLDSYKGGTHHVDQVFPNLFLGDVNIARDKKQLRKMGITHILNVAHASWECTDTMEYGPYIQYYGITAEDCPEFDISVFLRPGAKFIHNALSTPGGKILVHCVLGKSRSATMVLAYLMIYHHFNLADAIRHVCQYRCIAPNRGFLQQLQLLELDLNHTLWRCYMF